MTHNRTAAAVAALAFAFIAGVMPVQAATTALVGSAPVQQAACTRPTDYVVKAASEAVAASLAQRYGNLFKTEQAGRQVLFQRRAGDEAQQRELERLAADPALQVVEEARFTLDGSRSRDPLQFHNAALWRAIRRPTAGRWQLDEPVIVAVLDGPVRMDHEDLVDVVQIQPRLRDENGRCDGKECCPQIPSAEAFWHGTQVAGLIGAARGNGFGIAGVAPVRRIVSINAQVGGCIGEFSLAAALHCAIEYRDPDAPRDRSRDPERGQGDVRVANISMGSTQRLATRALEAALQRSTTEQLLIVASAGNDAHNLDRQYRWPGSHNERNLVTVETRHYDGTIAKGTNYGFGTVDLGAPAPSGTISQRLCTTSTPRRANVACSGNYASFDQSSAAAAIVSGAAALIWSDRRFARCNAQQMRDVLLSSRRHCRSGLNYRSGADQAVCMLDLAFLSRDATPEQALCSPREK